MATFQQATQGQPPPSRRQTRQQHSPTYPASPRPATKKTSPPPPKPKTEIYLPTYITVSDLARVLRVKLWDLQVKMRNMGHRDLRPDLTLPFSDAELIAAEHDLVAIANDEAAFDIYPRPPLLATSTAAEGSAAAAANLPIRPPIVTIMGHVDHGKTTLLDKLRSTSVAAGEAGGITQHIGAFSVPVVSSSSSSDSNAPQFVTFLDTPGHAAFTAMRSRGASVTDIVVLVVAADDGVMPQTREVIELWKDLASREAQFDPSSSTTTTTASARSNSDITESGTRTNRRLGSGSVQLVVALSKCDKPTADPERVKRELLSEGIELEEFGGEVPCVPVSGKTGEGLDLLQDTLVALAELAELRAEHDGPVEGYVIESRVEKGRGNVATVLVKRGALKVGDVGVAGQTWTKVRSLTSSSGASLRELKPGQAGIVTGWKELPSAGDEILGSAEGEAPAKKAVENRKRTAEARKLGEDVIKINEARRSVAEEAEKKKRAEWVERQQHRLAEAALSSGKSVAELIKETNDATAAAAAADAVATQDSSLEENAKEGEQAAVDSDKKELLLIVKADVSGSVEAVLGAVSDVGNKEAGVRIVSSGVGEPTDGDLAMARAVGARIICFNVPVSRSIERAAASQVPPTLIHSSPIIYRLMEYVSESVASLLPPLRQIRVTGEATIAQVFKINLKGRVFTNVAGCKITNGSVKRTSEIRILRNVSSASSASSSRQDDDEDDEEGDGGSGGGNEKTRDDSAGLQVGAVIGGGRKVVWIGKLDSLKHGKNEVPERGKGTECGMSFDGFQNFEEGDIVQAFYAVEVPRQLY
ncbi:translation initiation factor IF-2 [Tilletia horrida]|uniref:Translation initiation factor IF-2 n=1 Tax=Tilletia horrida TaxID=155126 RepID=A0AAN6JQT0_9BASI|nr:translation initiation factor IF-2 [Tilletia horrida]KAK0564239.1 translation initiation factor IF-2 [Tilletia horrida]